MLKKMIAIAAVAAFLPAGAALAQPAESEGVEMGVGAEENSPSNARVQPGTPAEEDRRFMELEQRYMDLERRFDEFETRYGEGMTGMRAESEGIEEGVGVEENSPSTDRVQPAD